MSYCQKCGKELQEGALFCESCGNKLQEKTTQHSGLGITALILSIIGFLTVWLGIGIVFDIVAIILSVILFSKAKKTGTKSSHSLPAMIIAIVSLATFILFVAILNSNPSISVEESAPEIKATIAIGDNKAEELTYHELLELSKGNAIAFEDKYKGSTITIVDELKRIDKSSISLENFNSLIMLHTWLINEDQLKTLKPGDKVKVTGILSTDPMLCVTGAVVRPANQ